MELNGINGTSNGGESKGGMLVEHLQQLILDRSMPNLIFVVKNDKEGKEYSSTFARALFGDLVKENFSVVDATSDYLDLIPFVRAQSDFPPVGFPFRVIAIIGMDRVPEHLQGLLMELIGDRIKTNRFVMTCGTTDFITNDLKDRCAIIDVEEVVNSR